MPLHTYATNDVVPAAEMNDIARQGRIHCTSGTRPAPSVGLLIYETDTRKTLEYNSSGQWERPWNEEWGWMGETIFTDSSPGTQTKTGVEDSNVFGTADFSLRKNRRYEVHFSGFQIVATTDTSTFVCGLWRYWGGSPNYTRLATAYSGNIHVGERLTISGVGIHTPTSNETCSFKLRHEGLAGASSYVQYQLNAGALARIHVRDIGPNGAP